MFRYIAVYQNRLIEGTIEAAHEEEALKKLREQGLTVIKLEIIEKETGRITNIDYVFIENFTRDMLQLLKAGLTFEKALLFIAGSYKKYSERLKSAVNELKKGNSLYQAFLVTGLFPRDYIELIRAGEESGKLYETLDLLYEFYRVFNKFKKEIISALIYPSFLAAVTLFALIILSYYVVPKFKMLFEITDNKLPLITRLVFVVTGNIQNLIVFLIGFLAFSLLFLLIIRKNKKMRIKFEEYILKLPIIGEKLAYYDIIKISYSLYILLKGGVPLDKSLSLVKDIASFEVFKFALQKTLLKIKEGESFYKSLSEEIFPKLVIEIVRIGEESGELAGAWYQVYISLSERLKDFISKVITLMEPLIILFMGTVVGFIVFGIVVGVFSLTGYM